MVHLKHTRAYDLKGFAITVAELETALERGMGFDGSSIAGFARVDESDMVAMPDPATFRILPWRPRENAVARMFCDILTPDGPSVRDLSFTQVKGFQVLKPRQLRQPVVLDVGPAQTE